MRSGIAALRLLSEASRPLTVAVALWVLASAVVPAAVVAALGVVVGAVADAVSDGFSGAAQERVAVALGVTGAVYAFSLVLDPIGSALGTAARTRITGALQQPAAARGLRRRSGSRTSRTATCWTGSRAPRARSPGSSPATRP